MTFVQKTRAFDVDEIEGRLSPFNKLWKKNPDFKLVQSPEKNSRKLGTDFTKLFLL